MVIMDNYRKGGALPYIGEAKDELKTSSMPSFVTSYYPSRQNTQTDRLTWEMWISVLLRLFIHKDYANRKDEIVQTFRKTFRYSCVVGIAQQRIGS